MPYAPDSAAFSRCSMALGVYSPSTFGVYLNLVEGLLWVQDVVRSNRTTPTIFQGV